MPQFDLHNFLPQLVWLAIFFAILYFGIVRATLPKIARVVDERDGKVRGDISAAETAKAESDRIRDAYEAAMTAAHADAHRTVTEANATVTRDTEAKLGRVKQGLDEKMASAITALDTARAAAMGEIEQIAAAAAADIVDRLTGVRPDDAIARTAARDAIMA